MNMQSENLGSIIPLTLNSQQLFDQFSSIQDLKDRCLIKRIRLTSRSAIYKYIDKESHERVFAVKITPITHFSKKEFNIGLDLYHTNIVRMFQQYEDMNINRSFIVMEYVDGVTLNKFIGDRDKKISFKKAETILSQIFETVCFILKKGIIPLDIHSENLMVGPKKHVTFIDFELYENFKKRKQLKQLSAQLSNAVSAVLEIAEDDRGRLKAAVNSINQHSPLKTDKTVTKEKKLETEIDFYSSITTAFRS